MRVSNAVVRLSWLIGALALVAAGIGLAWDGGSPYAVTTLRGQSADIFGQGLYRYDSLFSGAGNRGTDLVTLVLGIPLLLLSTQRYRRGSLRGGLLLTGTLGYFLYVYASYALGAVAYNELFLLYVALFTASLYAFLMAFTAVDLRALGDRFSEEAPRRGPALFMVASGVVTLVVWGAPLVAALLAGQTPERLDTYSTKLTEALDLATITPATFIAGALILKGRPLGSLIAISLLVLEVMLLPLITVQTISQVSAGVTFPPAQIAGPMIGFALLATLALRVLIILLRNISETEQNRPTLQGRTLRSA